MQMRLKYLLESFSSETWTTIVAASLHLNPQQVVVGKLEDLVGILFARSTNNNNANKDAAAIPPAVLSACVWTLALVAPKQVYERLATEVLEVLKNPALKEVSKVDLEIAALPEGELYNVEVIKCKSCANGRCSDHLPVLIVGCTV